MLFSPRSAVASLEGRRFLCRPASLHTLELALSLFGGEIAKVAQAYYAGGAPEEADPVEALIPLFFQDQRGAELLDSCVELIGGQPGELVEVLANRFEAQAELARIVALLSDLPRVVRWLNLEKSLDPAPTPPDPDGIPPLDAVAAALAGIHHVSPFIVFTWPADAVVALFDLLPDGDEAGGSISASASAEALAAAGFPIRRPAEK